MLRYNVFVIIGGAILDQVVTHSHTRNYESSGGVHGLLAALLV